MMNQHVARTAYSRKILKPKVILVFVLMVNYQLVFKLLLQPSARHTRASEQFYDAFLKIPPIPFVGILVPVSALPSMVPWTTGSRFKKPLSVLWPSPCCNHGVVAFLSELWIFPELFHFLAVALLYFRVIANFLEMLGSLLSFVRA